jgi:hypothetical protein
VHNPVALDMIGCVLQNLVVSSMFTPSYPLRAVTLAPNGMYQEIVTGEGEPQSMVHATVTSLVVHAHAVMATGSTTLANLTGEVLPAADHMLHQAGTSSQVRRCAVLLVWCSCPATIFISKRCVMHTARPENGPPCHEQTPWLQVLSLLSSPELAPTALPFPALQMASECLTLSNELSDLQDRCRVLACTLDGSSPTGLGSQEPSLLRSFARRAAKQSFACALAYVESNAFNWAEVQDVASLGAGVPTLLTQVPVDSLPGEHTGRTVGQDEISMPQHDALGSESGSIPPSVSAGTHRLNVSMGRVSQLTPASHHCSAMAQARVSRFRSRPSSHFDGAPTLPRRFSDYVGLLLASTAISAGPRLSTVARQNAISHSSARAAGRDVANSSAHTGAGHTARSLEKSADGTCCEEEPCHAQNRGSTRLQVAFQGAEQAPLKRRAPSQGGATSQAAFGLVDRSVSMRSLDSWKKPVTMTRLAEDEAAACDQEPRIEREAPLDKDPLDKDMSGGAVDEADDAEQALDFEKIEHLDNFAEPPAIAKLPSASQNLPGLMRHLVAQEVQHVLSCIVSGSNLVSLFSQCLNDACPLPRCLAGALSGLAAGRIPAGMAAGTSFAQERPVAEPRLQHAQLLSSCAMCTSTLTMWLRDMQTKVEHLEALLATDMAARVYHVHLLAHPNALLAVAERAFAARNGLALHQVCVSATVVPAGIAASHRRAESCSHECIRTALPLMLGAFCLLPSWICCF